MQAVKRWTRWNQWNLCPECALFAFPALDAHQEADKLYCTSISLVEIGLLARPVGV